MIVQKTQNESGAFVPNIPEGLSYQSATYRAETDDYLITFTPEQLEANRISPAQGKTQLSRLGKLQAVRNLVTNSGNEELEIFWEYATFWDKNTATVQSLAQAVGVDLEQFWIDAKQISL